MAKSYQATEPTQTPAAPPAETRDPEAWALDVYPPKASGASHHELWLHACARYLHRWSEHAHHAGAPLQLTRADYTAACEAARIDTIHGPALGAY